MGLWEQFGRKIEAKEREIREWQAKIDEAKVYIRTMQEAQRLVPRESPGNSRAVVLRPGSDIAKAEKAIRARGMPLHIRDLVKAIGKADTEKSRLALAGSIAAYVRSDRIFTRPAPNTFGLIDLGHTPVPEAGESKVGE